MAKRPAITGNQAQGEAPPPEAPREVVSGADLPAATTVAAANLAPETLDALGDRVRPDLVGLSPAEMARLNERELAPLNPVPAGAPPIVRTPVVAADSVQPVAAPADAPLETPPHQMDAAARAHQRQVVSSPRRFHPIGPAAITGAVPAVPVTPASEKVTPAAPPAADKTIQARPSVTAAGPAPAQTVDPTAAPAPYRPAESHTDSPARGIPRSIGDPGKQITGGFGSAADAQYFPLDGSEALKVVWTLMDELAQRLQNDLRFSMAVTYPRIAIRAQIVVEAYTEDHPITIERVAVSHDKTPIEIEAAIQRDHIPHTAQEQRRPHRERHGSRHLDDHECSGDTVPASPGRCRVSTFAQ